MYRQPLYRILLGYGIIGVVLSVVFTGAIYWTAHWAIDALVDRRLSDEVEFISDRQPVPNAQIAISRIHELEDRRETGDIGFLLLDANGRRLAGDEYPKHRPPLGHSALNARDQIVGIERGRAFGLRFGNGLTLYAIADSEPVGHFDMLLIGILALGAIGSVLLMTTSAAVVTRVVRLRVADVRATAEAIIAGNMQKRVPSYGSGGEFDLQAQAFNRMLDRIGELMAEVRHIAQDVAHDLRTPLARLRAQLSMLTRLSDDADAAAFRTAGQSALEQCDDIMALMAALLMMAEIEGGARRAHFASVQLDALARDVFAAYEPAALDSGRQLRFGRLEAARVHGDRALLFQALVNLVENALRYTQEGAQIEISATAGDRGPILTVADNGPGIAVEDRHTAMRRFGRLDASRSTEGHGMGLALVDIIARMHGGTVALSDAMPGLRVEILLPQGRCDDKNVEQAA